MILPETIKEVLIRELNHPHIKGKKFKDLLSLILDDQNLRSSYPTQPGKPNLDRIRSTTETAFQRAIFNGAYSILQFHDHEKTIHWVDLELPVTLSANPRRKCVDLIGQIDHQPTLCELKFMDRSASDEPKYAAFELATYYYFVLCNYDKLDAGKVHHDLDRQNVFAWQEVVREEPLLLVAANEKYWADWLGRKGYRDDLSKLVKRLNAELQTSLCLFQLEDIDFKRQKGNKDTYKPVVSSRYWKQL